MKLLVLTALCLTLAVSASPQAGALLWYVKSANTVISIQRLALQIVIGLTSCTKEKTPNTLTFYDESDCASRCPGYCTSFANCNATCVGYQCVCGQSQYCVANFKFDADGKSGVDCFDLTGPEPQKIN